MHGWVALPHRGRVLPRPTQAAAAGALDPALWRRVRVQAVLHKGLHEVAILLWVLP